jgi:hypothetical protein
MKKIMKNFIKFNENMKKIDFLFFNIYIIFIIKNGNNKIIIT